jgi:hypothetical protein
MEKMSITSSPYLKAGLQSAAISVSSPLQVTVASHGSLTTVSNSQTTYGGVVRAKAFVDSEVTTAMLESEAFNIPVSRLIDVWEARFGNKWIDLETLEGDEFFSSAFKRLKQLGEVEVHFLTDRARYVCRMPEQ